MANKAEREIDVRGTAFGVCWLIWNHKKWK